MRSQTRPSATASTSRFSNSSPTMPPTCGSPRRTTSAFSKRASRAIRSRASRPRCTLLTRTSPELDERDTGRGRCAPRGQSLLRSQARCALLPAPSPRDGPSAAAYARASLTRRALTLRRYAFLVGGHAVVVGSRGVLDVSHAIAGAKRPSSGGSPREGVRSEERAEQRLAAGGRRLPRPGLGTYGSAPVAC